MPRIYSAKVNKIYKTETTTTKTNVTSSSVSQTTNKDVKFPKRGVAHHSQTQRQCFSQPSFELFNALNNELSTRRVEARRMQLWGGGGWLLTRLHSNTMAIFCLSPYKNAVAVVVAVVAIVCVCALV